MSSSILAQSPHGAAMKMDCSACHRSDSWNIPAAFWKNNALAPNNKVSKTTDKPVEKAQKTFQHDADTDFALSGAHAAADCRSCHATLVFSEADPACISCHTDIHRNTVGDDCRRCHTSNSWLVDNITELHTDNGFPLLGAHATANCNACHISESGLEFNRIGNACINCHGSDFSNTTNPNHQDAGFSINCQDCHQVDAFEWTAQPIEHSFFPLTKGHQIEDCAACHTGGPFSQTPTSCVACHQSDFENASDPNHIEAGFPNDCAACHTTDVGWMPATFSDHDAQYFPIYSGAHEGVWNQCSECHTNASNYAEFSCVACHLNPDTDDEHEGVGAYVYENTACLACHPTGDADMVFDHNQTAFPLTGAHIGANCLDCHAAGYEGTPTACAGCHTDDFNQASNPNHVALGLSTDCASCHTTQPGWAPAT
ncbi:MAG TPA: hypothetical protein PLZ12_20615, partial [Saprospiraceae bacterium]|nr:hypothetical protein [Saprospiraceae bacterium]